MHEGSLNPNPSDLVRSPEVPKRLVRSPSAYHHARKSSAKMMRKRLKLLFEDPIPVVKAVESEYPLEAPTRVIQGESMLRILLPAFFEIPNCYGGCNKIPNPSAEISIEASVCEDDTMSSLEELPSLPSMPFSDYNPSNFPVSTEDVYEDVRAFMARKEELLKSVISKPTSCC